MQLCKYSHFSKYDNTTLSYKQTSTKSTLTQWHLVLVHLGSLSTSTMGGTNTVASCSCASPQAQWEAGTCCAARGVDDDGAQSEVQKVQCLHLLQPLLHLVHQPLAPIPQAAAQSANSLTTPSIQNNLDCCPQ